MNKILLFFIVLFGISCNCHKKMNDTTVNKTNKLEELAIAKFGKNYQSLYNSDKDYVVIFVKKSIRSNHPFPTLKFAIYETKSSILIHEDSVPGGAISWQSNELVKVTSQVGRPKNMYDTKSPKIKYLYNVNMKKKSRSKI